LTGIGYLDMILSTFHEEAEMSLRDLMHTEIVKMGPSETLLEAARVMRSRKIGSIFVEEKGQYLGIVTESALVRKALTKGLPPDSILESIMEAPLASIDVEKSVVDANHLMHLNGIRYLSVSEKDAIIGMISIRDMVAFFSSEAKETTSAMGDIIKPLTVLTHRDIQSVQAASSTKDAARQMGRRKVGSLLVKEDGDYVGIVTEVDMVRKVISYGLSPEEMPVGVIMNAPIVDIDIGASIFTATEMMASKDIRHLAVREEGAIVGIVSIRDLIVMISVRDLPRFYSKK